MTQPGRPHRSPGGHPPPGLDIAPREPLPGVPDIPAADEPGYLLSGCGNGIKRLPARPAEDARTGAFSE